MGRSRGGRVGVRMRVTVVGVQDSRVVTTSAIAPGDRVQRDARSGFFKFVLVLVFIGVRPSERKEEKRGRKKKKGIIERERELRLKTEILKALLCVNIEMLQGFERPGAAILWI